LPPLSYLILLILWLGTGDASKIALLYLTAFPIVASSAMAGVWTTKLQRIQAARPLGAYEWKAFRYVVFPSALAVIFMGSLLALVRRPARDGTQLSDPHSCLGRSHRGGTRRRSLPPRSVVALGRFPRPRRERLQEPHDLGARGVEPRARAVGFRHRRRRRHIP